MLKTSSTHARSIGSFLAAIIFTLLLGACSPGGLFSGHMMYAPHREVTHDADTLQSALTALGEGDRSGQIRLSEAELSSLLSLVLAGGPGEGQPVREVQARLEADTVYLKFVLRDRVLPLIPGEAAVNMEAKLHTRDGRLVVDVQRAGLGVLPILAPALIDQIETHLQSQITTLVDRSTPLNITVEPGELVIDLP